ncbi:MAG: hypothetical protein DHS20C10_08880 [marine bacterium B5-7]|nr:MAG: hypothetical protein DHS20C10_08880 [marine bacterium B5-7]
MSQNNQTSRVPFIKATATHFWLGLLPNIWRAVYDTVRVPLTKEEKAAEQMDRAQRKKELETDNAPQLSASTDWNTLLFLSRGYQAKQSLANAPIPKRHESHWLWHVLGGIAFGLLLGGLTAISFSTLLLPGAVILTVFIGGAGLAVGAIDPGRFTFNAILTCLLAPIGLALSVGALLLDGLNFLTGGVCLKLMETQALARAEKYDNGFAKFAVTVGMGALVALISVGLAAFNLLTAPVASTTISLDSPSNAKMRVLNQHFDKVFGDVEPKDPDTISMDTLDSSGEKIGYVSFKEKGLPEPTSNSASPYASTTNDGDGVPNEHHSSPILSQPPVESGEKPAAAAAAAAAPASHSTLTPTNQ